MIGIRIQPASMAAEACKDMTEEQRIAFAIELVRDVRNPRNASHLHRLANLARDVQTGLLETDWNAEAHG